MAKEKEIKSKSNFWGWFFCIWFLITAIVSFTMPSIAKLYGVFFLIVAFVFYPKSTEITSKLFNKDFQKKQKIKTVIFSFVVLIIVAIIVSSMMDEDIKKYDANKYVEANTSDFLLNRNDLSTEWQFGPQNTGTPEIINGMTPIETKNQQITLVNGMLSADSISVYVSKFDNTEITKSYFSSVVNEIISKGGYSEVDTGRENCFAKEAKTAYFGTITTANCYMGNYFIKISYYNDSGNDISFFKSIINIIHNKFN